jgi:hypothetical protein
LKRKKISSENEEDEKSSESELDDAIDGMIEEINEEDVINA